MEKDPAKRGVFTRSEAPTAADLDAFRRRESFLSAKLRPCDGKTLARMIGECFLAYDTMHARTGKEVLQQIQAYGEVLKDLPEWALRAAFKKIADGHTDERYVPTAKEIRILAQYEAKPFRDEWHELDAVIKAPVVDDPRPPLEQRIEFVDRLWFNGLRKEIPSKDVRSPEQEERHEALMQETARAGDKMVQEWRRRVGIEGEGKHSPELLAKFEQIRQGNVGPENESGHESQQDDRSRSA
jgi:hypothetical protein